MPTTRYKTQNSRSGFTLVEISIVLLILAIATGGIMVGAEMIHTAKVRSVISEKETFVQSLRTFKDRYKFYPGDLPNAKNIWGELHATDSTCITTESPRGQTSTCNGNGDGIIGGIGDGSYVTDGAQLFEMFRAWQHLVNAELLTGYFTGVAHTSVDVDAYASAPLRHANSAAVFGTNAPQSNYRSNAGWNIGTTWGLYNSCNDSLGKNLNGNALVFASHAEDEDFNIGMTDGVEKLLSPQELKVLDEKTDDGLPSSGGFQASGLECSVDCTANAAYNIQNEENVCGMIFVNQF